MDYQCDICTSNCQVYLTAVNWRDPESNKGYQILKCDACGHGKTLSASNDTSLYSSQFYDAKPKIRLNFFKLLIETIADIFVVLDRRWRMTIPKTLGVRPSCAEIADIGCGDGGLVDYLNENGWSATGFEYSEYIRKVNPKIRDIATLEQIFSQFNFIYLNHVMEHTQNPLFTLKKIKNTLKPNGFIYIEVPNFDSAEQEVFGEFNLHLDVPRHIHHFTESSLTILIQKAGFRVQKRQWLPFIFFGTALRSLWSMKRTIPTEGKNTSVAFLMFLFRKCFRKKSPVLSFVVTPHQTY